VGDKGRVMRKRCYIIHTLSSLANRGEKAKDGKTLTSLALRASVNGLTGSPFVLYGAHNSLHQHPSSAKAADGHALSPRRRGRRAGEALSTLWLR